MGTVKECHLYKFPSFSDGRGTLTVNEAPQPPKRVFWITQAPDGSIRGNHVHKQCAHWLVAVSGHVIVKVDDGVNQNEFLLNNPSVALYVPPMIWDSETFINDAILLVFASDGYSENDYIRDYEVFKRLRA